jgi:phospholipid/cholesterol/gamma-HCH transport system permease protein
MLVRGFKKGCDVVVSKILAAIIRQIEALGALPLAFLSELGLILLFFARSIKAAFRRPWRFTLWFQQAEFVGVGSLFIIFLTGIFTGAVFTLQSVQALQRFGLESMVGSMVVLAVSRELAPVLTSLMVAGRVGSAMATELGTMRVSEQIDAMEVMAVDPYSFLVAPRILASVVMVPALTMIFDMVATFGSYVVATIFMDIDQGSYMSRIEWYVDPFDFMHGLYKSVVFGAMVALIGCYKGYNAKGGARGVGIATTQAVVLASIGIFILNYFLTSTLIAFEPD